MLHTVCAIPEICRVYDIFSLSSQQRSLLRYLRMLVFNGKATKPIILSRAATSDHNLTMLFYFKLKGSNFQLFTAKNTVISPNFLV